MSDFELEFFFQKANQTYSQALTHSQPVIWDTLIRKDRQTEKDGGSMSEANKERID